MREHNSPLVSHTHISPHKYNHRNHKIDTITIHCVVGQCSVETLGNIFDGTSKVSANYGIGPDGRIGLYVPEESCSWCSSNLDNDNRAITIEVASDTSHPYMVTDKAYAALIDLLVDICRRNGIRQLLWRGDKRLIGQVEKQNMTVHRWFANKACPGDYLYQRHGAIAAEVNRRLGGFAGDAAAPDTAEVPYQVQVTAATLNIRKGPGTGYPVTGHIRRGGIYTITAAANGPGAAKWGKLKSGAGWISLDHVRTI